MPLKERGQSTELAVVDEWDGGVGWMAHPRELMERASHALVVDEKVWLVDPLDAPGIDDLIGDLGPVAGVIVTLNRHTRDAAEFASRYNIPVFLPSWIEPTVSLDVQVQTVTATIPGTEMQVIRVFDVPGWREAAVYDAATDTLVVGDALGTAQYFVTAEERLGVHPMLRLFPPKAFDGLEPDRILVGHGNGIFENVTEILTDALNGARRRYPELLVTSLRKLLMS